MVKKKPRQGEKGVPIVVKMVKIESLLAGRITTLSRHGVEFNLAIDQLELKEYHAKQELKALVLRKELIEEKLQVCKDERERQKLVG